MAYEPSERVLGLLQLMRAAPERIWTSGEAGEALQVLISQVPSYLASAVKHGVVHRGLINGRLVYGLQALPAAGPVADTRVPQIDPSWSPPKMIATRPGSEPAPRRAPPSQVAAPALTPAPTAPPPAVTPAPAPIDPPPAPPAVVEEPAADEVVEAAAAESEHLDEAVEADAYISCRTGEIVLVGLEPDDDGRVTVPADLVQLLKQHLAWSPAR